MSKERESASEGKIIVFGAKKIRRLWVDEEWFFSVVDIVVALTDSNAPSKYWTAMKRREEESSGFQLSTICRQLKMTSADGKLYETEAVNSCDDAKLSQRNSTTRTNGFPSKQKQEKTAEKENLKRISRGCPYRFLPEQGAGAKRLG